MMIALYIVMKIAIPERQGRISPVFDVAEKIVLINAENIQKLEQQTIEIEHRDPFSRAKEISALGADVLICGAISYPFEMALAAAGIQVIPNICGDVDKALTAFMNGTLSNALFWMPGCCGNRQRMRGRQRRRGRRFSRF